jgi:hypothetical protein
MGPFQRQPLYVSYQVKQIVFQIENSEAIIAQSNQVHVPVFQRCHFGDARRAAHSHRVSQRAFGFLPTLDQYYAKRLALVQAAADHHPVTCFEGMQVDGNS